MKAIFPFRYIVTVVICSLLYASCVSDIDLDRGDEVVFMQQVDLDLVYFTLETSDFEGANDDPALTTVRDSTRLEFLEEDFVQENLKEVEFTFKAINTFPQSLINQTQFLNEDGGLEYELSFEILPSTDGTPVTSTFVESIDELEIDAILNSIEVASEVTVVTTGAPISGALTIQSKALYSLEFRDL